MRRIRTTKRSAALMIGVCIALLVQRRSAAQIEPPQSFDREVDGDVSLAPGPATQPASDVKFQVGPACFVGERLTMPSFSPDSHFLVAADGPRHTLIFSVPDGKTTAVLPPAKQTIFLSADRLAQLSNDGVRIVDRSGKPLFTLATPHPSKLAASQDGTRLAIADGAPFFPADSMTAAAIASRQFTPIITLWDTTSGQKIANLDPVFHAGKEFPGREGLAAVEECGTTLGFDPAGALVTVAADGHVHRRDGSTGKPEAIADIIVDPAVPASLSPDGKTIILSDATPRAIDLSTGTITAIKVPFADSHPNQGAKLTAIASTFPSDPLSPPHTTHGVIQFSRDENLVIFREHESLCRWDIAAKQFLSPIKPWAKQEETAISPDGRFIATATNGELNLHDLHTGRSLTPTVVPQFIVSATAQSADGSNLYVGDEGGSIYRFDLHTGQLAAWRRLDTDDPEKRQPILAIGVPTDGRSVWTFGNHGQIVWRDPKSLQPMGNPQIAPFVAPFVTPLGQSQDDQFLIGLVPGDKQATLILTTTDGATQPLVTAKAPETKPGAPIAVSPNHERGACAEHLLMQILPLDLTKLAPGSILQFMSMTATINADNLHTLHRPFDCSSIRFTPDGRRIVGISPDGPICFDAIDATILWAQENKIRQPRRRASLSDDGTLLAYADLNDVRIINVADGEAVATIPGDTPVRGVQMMHDGPSVLILQQNAQIRIVDWRSHTDSAGGDLPKDDWEAMFSASPAQAYAALFRLMQSPGKLLERRAEVEAHMGSAGRYGQLIAQLSSDNQKEREQAHHALERAGRNALAAVRHSLALTPDGEVHDRLAALVDLADTAAPTATPVDEPPSIEGGAIRYLQALRWLNTPESQQALSELSNSTDMDIASYSKLALDHVVTAAR